MLPRMAAFLTYMKGLKPGNKIGAAFGSYGWSGEVLKHLNAHLEEMNVELVSDGIRVQYVPDAEDLEKCFQFGAHIASELSKRLNK